METNEELNRWAHSFLGKKMPEPEVCPVCNVPHDSHKARFNNEVKALPDYCSSLDLAAKVEAKLREDGYYHAYIDALEDLCKADLVSNDDPWCEAGKLVFAPALTRVQAAKRAVEGK